MPPSATEREQALRRVEADADQRARKQARDYLLDARKRVEAAVAAAAEARTEEEAREARRVVEEAISELGTEGRKDGRTEGTTEGRKDGLTEGARVRLLSGTVAQVEEIRADGRLVLSAGSVRLTVPQAEVREVLPVNPSVGQSVVPSFRPSVPDGDASFEIDLRGLRVDEAEAAMVSALDAAVQADNPFLRIIHGKGTGAVRERVHEVLKGDRRVRRYALAPANQGGSGATIAEFRS